MPFTFHAIKHHIVSPLFSKALAPPLCVEIGNVIVERLVIHGVVNLVEKCADGVLVVVFERDACACAERHRKVHVETAVRHYGDRHGIY